MSFSKIALIGYRATGKSSVGRKIAERLNWKFIDMDEVLMKTFQMTIAEWIQKKGWESFRKEEHNLLKALEKEDLIVVATGGGIVEREENRTILRRSFFTVWLDCEIQEIIKRLQKDSKTSYLRPSLTGLGTIEEIEKVLALRRPLYREVSSLMLKTDKSSIDEICDHLLRSMEQKEKAK